MIVIDSSALLTMLLDERDAPLFARALEQVSPRLLSAANLLETAIVIEARKGEKGGVEFDLLLHRAQIEVVEVDRTQAQVAREAWRRFGRARHRAGLNYGDCFAYALAKTRRAPLLFKGEDFAQTDIERVTLV